MKNQDSAVLINADDFGLTESCTKAIAESFQKGLITDTTMVANGSAMELAFQLAPALDGHIGVHINLTEGAPLTPEIGHNPKFVRNGVFTDYFRFRNTYFRPLSQQDVHDLYTEMTAQVERLIAGGIRITHADSHHHIHWNWTLAPIFFRVCREHNITKIRCHKNINGAFKVWNGLYAGLYKLRLQHNHFRSPDHFESIRQYESCPRGISEMMVHPDYDRSGMLIDRKRKETAPDGQVCAVGPALEELFTKCAANCNQTNYSLL